MFHNDCFRLLEYLIVSRYYNVTCAGGNHDLRYCLNWLINGLFGSFGLAGGRVVKSLSNKQSRVRIPLPPKVLGSDEIICKYSPI